MLFGRADVEQLISISFLFVAVKKADWLWCGMSPAQAWAIDFVERGAEAEDRGQSNNEATYHSTKHHKQLDYVLMNRALFNSCKDAETTGKIDMNSDHKAVIAWIELLIGLETQQTKRTENNKPKKQRRSGDSRINWSGHTIDVYQKYQEHPQHDQPKHDGQTTQQQRTSTTNLKMP